MELIAVVIIQVDIKLLFLFNRVTFVGTGREMGPSDVACAITSPLSQ